MIGSKINIDLFKIFCDVVETKSFSKAAERNFITQSAVSQQISNLEYHFAKKLIIRGKGKFSLTSEGRIFLNGCNSILSSFQDTIDQMEAKLGNLIQTVNIETIYSIGFYRFPIWMKNFMFDYRNINLHIEYNKSDRIYKKVTRGGCDIGIIAYPWNHPLIDVQYINEEKLVVVCSPSYPLSTNLKISLKQLDGLDMVNFIREIPTRNYVDNILNNAKIKVNHIHEFDNVETLKRSIELGDGFAILPKNTVQQEIANNDLVSIEISEGPFYRKVGIISRKNRPQSKAIKTVINRLKKL